MSVDDIHNYSIDEERHGQRTRRVENPRAGEIREYTYKAQNHEQTYGKIGRPSGLIPHKPKPTIRSAGTPP